MTWHGPRGNCGCCRCSCPGSSTKYRRESGVPHLKVSLVDLGVLPDSYDVDVVTAGFLGKGGKQDLQINGLHQIFGTYFFELGTDENGCLDYSVVTPPVILTGSTYSYDWMTFNLLCQPSQFGYLMFPMRYRIAAVGSAGVFTVFISWQRNDTQSLLDQPRFAVGGVLRLECSKHFLRSNTVTDTSLLVRQTFSGYTRHFDGNAGFIYSLWAQHENDGCGSVNTSPDGPLTPVADFDAEVIWI